MNSSVQLGVQLETPAGAVRVATGCVKDRLFNPRVAKWGAGGLLPNQMEKADCLVQVRVDLRILVVGNDEDRVLVDIKQDLVPEFLQTGIDARVQVVNVDRRLHFD